MEWMEFPLYACLFDRFPFPSTLRSHGDFVHHSVCLREIRLCCMVFQFSTPACFPFVIVFLCSRSLLECVDKRTHSNWHICVVPFNQHHHHHLVILLSLYSFCIIKIIVLLFIMSMLRLKLLADMIFDHFLLYMEFRTYKRYTRFVACCRVVFFHFYIAPKLDAPDIKYRSMMGSLSVHLTVIWKVVASLVCFSIRLCS